MSLSLECFLANAYRVVRDRGTAEIGGGVFNHVELAEIGNAILRLQQKQQKFDRREEQIKRLLQHLDPDGSMPIFDELRGEP